MPAVTAPADSPLGLREILWDEVVRYFLRIESTMCNPAKAFRGRLTVMLITILGFTLVVPALSQDKMVLGPRQFETDTSGAGAVLCLWSIYLSVQAETAACALPRRPVDDAIDQAIVAMDDFIIANSSLHPTKAMLEAFKRDATASDIEDVRQAEAKVCKGPNLEGFRRPSAEKIQATVKKLLAIPREPVMNPCL